MLVSAEESNSDLSRKSFGIFPAFFNNQVMRAQLSGGSFFACGVPKNMIPASKSRAFLFRGGKEGFERTLRVCEA
jgi:hypothetical protein